MPLRTSLHRKGASGRWSSRRRKEVLSVNMISLPLADFRHLSHIGNDAHRDSFGDLSFLKMGHNLLLQSSQSEQNLFQACSPPPKPPRLNVNDPDGSESPDPTPQTHQRRTKKSSSMPLLDREDRIIEEEETLKSTAQDNRCEPKSLSLDRNGNPTVTGENTRDEDSGFNFNLDLGPSILDDVLQVMDKLHH